MASGQGNRSNGKSKSTGKKSSSGKTQSRPVSGKGKNTASGRAARQSEPMDLAIRNEIILIGVLALAIFLFLCNFGIVGVVGDLVSDTMFGILGLISYVAPVLFFLAVAFGISNRGNSIAARKLVAAFILLLLIGMACDLFTGAWNEKSLYNVKELYGRCSRDHNGGGVIGGTLAFLACHFLSMVGTVLLMVVLAVICLVIITEKSVMKGVKSGGQLVYERTREDVYNRRERAQRRREEQERLRKDREEERRLKKEAEENEKILRMDKKVSGVMLDTTLPAKQEKKGRKAVSGARDDIHEIVINDWEEADIKGVEVTAEKASENEFPPEFDKIRITSAYHQEPDGEEGYIGYEENQEAGNGGQGGYAGGYGSVKEAEQKNGTIRAAGNADRKERTAGAAREAGYGRAAGEAEGAHMAQGRAFMASDEIQEVTFDATELGTKKSAFGYTEKGEEETDSGFAGESAKKPSFGTAQGIKEVTFEFPEADEKEEDFGVPKAGEKENAFGFADEGIGEVTFGLPEESEEETDFDAAEESLEKAGAIEPEKPGATERAAASAGAARVRPAARLAEEAKTSAGNSAVMSGMEQGEMKRQAPLPPKEYIFPSINFLKKGKNTGNGDSDMQLKQTAVHLQQTLATFGVRVTITDISQGPTVTRYEMQPDQGVKVSKIVGLADDIKLNLAATDIRIEAPIPGKAAVGIEVPNKENSVVGLRELLESREFREFHSDLAFAVGKDIGGKTVVADIARMPHMLIAGSTGSGKSVCINTLIMSILYKAHPDDVKLIMVDPKVVELSVYNGIPHLMIPVVTDPKKAAAALQWGVAEMTDRYKKFADFNVRNLKGYNEVVEGMKKRGEDAPAKMPKIVIIVDELADLMMVAPGEVEESICRLAQLARAAGIHLIIATQRPSVDVITGLIKANMPSRVAFAVSSGVDSRTILDMNGAEKLLGKGDMLFYPQGYPKPARVQGAFVSDSEVSDVVDFLKNQAIGNVYSADVEAQIKTMGSAPAGGGSGSEESSFDQYFADAGRFIIEKDKASIGMLQRVFKIGFNRAARIMDQLCEAGVVGEEEGTKPRKVLMGMEEFEQLVEETI